MKFLNFILSFCFITLIVRPFILIIVGLNVRHYQRLPKAGPALIVANHNSHLDAMVLLSLFPITKVFKIRMVAAADYFLKNRFVAWFSMEILRIIPVKRSPIRMSKEDPLQGVSEALQRGEIVIFFPEGTRGEPEKMASFKTGIAWISKRHPQVPIYPIFLHGLGKALPRGEALLVPFFCDVFVGEPFYWGSDRSQLLEMLRESIQSLADEGHFPSWE